MNIWHDINPEKGKEDDFTENLFHMQMQQLRQERKFIA